MGEARMSDSQDKEVPMSRARRVAVLVVSAVLSSPLARVMADEGMWLYNAPPLEILKDRYGFEPNQAWLEHLQKASVRFNSGGSGSFVSADGLVLSNHHVGADALQKFGDKDHDYLRDGFHARTLAQEKRCLDLELNVLMEIGDVTDRVNAAVKPDLSAEQAFLARRAVLAQIEKESLDRTGLRSDVVTLYQGGLYHLYRFKKYTDVRLVFAPEQQIAFFGGDPDNFEYPRYDLDFCLFRAYEDGRPARIPHFLRWSKAGAAEDELVFVSGHPGRTSRLLTVAELEHLRDARLPYSLAWLKDLEVLLTAYSARSQENARRAKEDLFGVQNSRKVYDGRYAGMLDPGLLAAKRDAEQRLRQAVAARPDLVESVDAWDRIAEAQKAMAENTLRYSLLEGRHGLQGDLFSIARTLVRAAEERPKPNA
ncbi:MAG: S46 family peptidase, partial [Phycisphaerae bacterium]|nr:S46 family peptidase [Phycisphaerae bacterium]